MHLQTPSILIFLAACAGGGDVKLATYEDPPALTIIAPTNGAEFDQGAVVNFAARVSDDQDAPEALTLIWSSDVDGELSSGQADADGNIEFATANLSPGFTHTISLQAIDSDALSNTATVAVNIIALPDAPEISVVQPASGQSGIEGQAFEFIAQVFDSLDAPEDLTLAIETDFSEGRFCATTPDATGKASCSYALSPGVHQLTFTVADTEGYTASSVVYFTVVASTDIDDDLDGWTESQGDCDDTNPSINPASEEVENGVDDDCNGAVDEGTDAYDDDGDGFSENSGDCDDDDSAIHPDAIEVCGNSVDENCDSSLEDIDAIGCSDYYYDYDGDSYGTSTKRCMCSPDGYYTARNDSDCYDYNASANPAQSGYFSTQRGDGKYDYNCDGSDSKYYTTTGSCTWAGDCDMNTAGWVSSSPSCGTTASYVKNDDSCDWSWSSFGCVTNSSSSQTQTCR